MTPFNPAPKPESLPPKPVKWLRNKTPLPRATKPIARSWLKPGTKRIPQVNTRRRARRAKTYAAHLRSPYWQELRLLAYQRDGGLCQCDDCIAYRKHGGDPELTRIEVWFVKGSTKIRGFATHHDSYARFGHEALSDVRTMIPKHHNRLEARTGKRRAFLRTLEAAA